MRILIASSLFPPQAAGEADHLMERHARALLQRGHEVVVLGGTRPVLGQLPGALEPEESGGQFHARQFHADLSVYRLTMPPAGPAANFRWPSLARRLTSLILMHDIDVVHLHDPAAFGLDAILAVHAAGRRCVVTLPDGTPTGAESFTHEGERLPARLRHDFSAWCLEQADQAIPRAEYLAAVAPLPDAEAAEWLEALYAAPAVARPMRRPVVLIGPGEAPEGILALLGQLQAHLAPAAMPRLLRQDWLPPGAWAAAALLWLWGPAQAEATALQALRAGLPVLAPGGIGMERWVAAGGPVLTYATPLEALAALQVLLEHPAIRHHLAREASLQADAAWAAPLQAFALTSQLLG
jgi:glycosyltransferase involved in cell wall biosynthesis